MKDDVNNLFIHAYLFSDGLVDVPTGVIILRVYARHTSPPHGFPDPKSPPGSAYVAGKQNVQTKLGRHKQIGYKIAVYQLVLQLNPVIARVSVTCSSSFVVSSVTHCARTELDSRSHRQLCSPMSSAILFFFFLIEVVI